MSLYARTAAAYARRRVEDPRLAAAIHAALGDARTVVNVGAGTGSYEPRDRAVTAVEPEPAMIAARATPAVRAAAEALPFADGAFEAAMAVLTVHHWADWRAGADELRDRDRARLAAPDLDREVQRAISALALLDPAVLERGLGALARDLADGTWAARHADLADRTSLDLGYRLVVSRHN